MKKTRTTMLAWGGAMLVAVLTGCESPYGTPNRAGTGALIGTGFGAASGALIGGRHHAVEGALIGGAVGAVTGGLIGHSMDQEAQARLQAQAPQTYQRIDQGQPLGLADVKALSKAGLSDDVIISQIRSTRTVYRLSAADIVDLHSTGVSQKVIDYMINTPTTVGSAAPQTEVTVVQRAPPPIPTETVVIAPGPGYVWVDGEWVWNGRWVWVGGHWGRPPRPGVVWVRGYWARGPRGWHQVRGHWH